ncbi:MAG TPA: ATP-binding protein, partial [Steroidobacteraceae bacterium]|nr:ATP-binding protein [Steroidobacteraceae bacterium]
TQGLQAIERNSRIQAQMISDLLDHASIAFGKIRLTPEAVDPYKAVRAALETSSSAAQVAGVRLNASFSGWGLTVDADPDRLQQIVLNLLSNAVKFSNAGDSVDVVADQVDNSFRLTVTDHGRGIEASFLPRIFEHFSQQENSTTRSRGGLGLGLAIVKQLVDLHGGSIEASSDGIGLGATFTLTLPLSQRVSSTLISESQLLSTLDLSALAILVVDDDADSRLLTTRILKEVGATVIDADSAEKAIALIAENKPDLIVSDIGMPEQDGYTMLRRLRSMGYSPEQLPAIALTAFARAEDRAQALDSGFQDHLIKPLDPQALLRRIASLRIPEERSPSTNA